MKLLRGIIMMSLFCCLLVVFQSSGASANLVWPLQVDTRVGSVYAHENGSLTVTNCDSSSAYPSALHIRADGTISTLPSYGEANILCTPLHGGPTVINGMGTLSANGVFYAMKRVNYVTYLTAFRSGRQLWQKELHSPVDCSGSSYENYGMKPISMAVAKQGGKTYLYAVLTSMLTPHECPDRFIALDIDDGSVLFNNALPSEYVPYVGITPVIPRMWAYDNKVVMVTDDGVLREFDYDGTENISKRYTFPVPTDRGIFKLLANEDGRVFAFTRLVYTSSGSAPILYHDDDGTHGAFSAVPYSRFSRPTALTADGGVVATHANKVYKFDVNTSSYMTVTIPDPTGYSGYIFDYVEDQNGNGVVVRNLSNSNGDHMVSVERIDGATNAVTMLFQLDNDPVTGRNPQVTGRISEQSVAGGNMYLPICYSGTSCYASSASPSDVWIHKIPLTNFGEAVLDTQQYTSYESQKLEYVAMGDSFSSGEGDPDFTHWTNRNDENECHRSKEKAYPTLLANDPSLNLNLVDFVACSGATTANVLNGGSSDGAWDEAPQVDTLSTDTDVVTVTIGGNDVGFVEYATICVIGPCGPGVGQYAYDAIMDNINAIAFSENLQTTYETILENAPNAEVYVLDYPYLFDPTGQDNTSCVVIDSSGGTLVQSALNTSISLAVAQVRSQSADYSNRLHYVNTNSVGSPFGGKHLCTDDPEGSSFNGIILPPLHDEYSLHPNSKGHTDYYAVLKTLLD